jgi:uncharacterized protein (TIGR00661 family)
MQNQKRILICPLDWGLGHATRCIPIIRLFIQKNAEVIIAANGGPFELLKKEFPYLEFIRLKGYEINYPNNDSMILKMLFSIPKILQGIKAEHKALKKIIHKKKIDVVISDNRFGLWNKESKNIFITHQLMIKAPFAEKLLHRINLKYIKKFDECWIPDIKGEKNLSGDLSHKYKLPENAFFIGTLSRFNLQSETKDLPVTDQYDIMAIISGPEPQRGIFEKLISESLYQSGLKALIVCGKTDEEQKEETKGNLEIVNHLKADKMQRAILNSKIIIARSGYSTLMDLTTLCKKAVFIPTPGQTEQEYLAERLMQKKIIFYQKQSEFNLQNILEEAENYSGFKLIESTSELEKRIESILVN